MLENELTQSKNITDAQLVKTYNIIKTYPIPTEPIRYPRPVPGDYRYQCTINDVLCANMNAIVPNIDIGVHKGTYTIEDLAKWIKITKKYFSNLNVHIQEKCDKQMKKLILIEELKEKTRVLNLKKLDRLPEDMIRYIYEFLMPETKIKFLLFKYPDYETALQKMTNNNLKTYLKDVVYKNYIAPISSYNAPERQRVKCLQNELRFVLSFTNKKNYTDQIQTVFLEYCGAIPRTLDDNYYFQSRALRLLQSIIYVAYYKGKILYRNKKQTTTSQVQALAD
jgi:hypothetical protein